MLTLLHNDILLPERLNCPFYYQPHPIALAAVDEVRALLDATDEWRDEMSAGKMFGVLVVKDARGNVGYLKAYSGQIGGREDWAGWVPAVFDYLQPDGYFKTHETEITALNTEISDMEHSARYQIACSRLAEARADADRQISEYREFMFEQKILRAERRQNGDDEAELIRESQFQKAEMKRLKARLAANVGVYEDVVRHHEQLLIQKKHLRRQMSDNLQHWLFSQFVVQNGRGQSRNLLDIFSETPQRIPPSGAGECCAPKLLQYAFTHELTPVAIAEFWWGRSPVGEVRQHLNFYPACQGKCRPILDFMLQGVDVEPNPLDIEKDIKKLDVVYSDEYLVVVNKPAGLLSVPGKELSVCAQSILSRQLSREVYAVHRLDMQTSGMLMFALSEDVQRTMQKMFASRQVKKKYVAVLDGCFEGPAEGTISLPLSSDFMNRPRQMVDYENGKSAVTIYNIMYARNNRTFVALYPQTGRTHQLRVHCAHHDGLGIPIVGDDLYGTHAERLLLHAESLDFTHPVTGESMHIERKSGF